MRKSTMIQTILDSLNWEEIQDYHNKLNILWDIQKEDGTKKTTVPSVFDIKEELNELLQYVTSENLDYLSYGNWIIFAEEDEFRVVFRLNDWVFKRNTIKESIPYHVPFISLDKDELENTLERALKVEDYELAAELRDAIHKIDKKD
jgi:hypothetical protein